MEVISKEQIEAWYRKALSDLTINVDLLAEIAKNHNLKEAEELQKLIKRNIKEVTFFRNNN